MNFIICILFSILFCQWSHSAEQDFNPYEVLGVPRTATEKDIRQAYKKLAKHWHPDKNSEPNANEQFTKINAAYEILSDSTKRQNYDEYGTTSQDNQRGFNTNHFRDPFDVFRAHFGGDFHFFRESPTGAKKIIHVREFLSDILPNSDRKPYVLFGSTNFCFQCRQALATFRSLEQQFNDVGIGTAEFNVNDQRLSNELGILNAPSLCVISQRRVYHFDDQGKVNSYSESNIKEFLRKSIPIHRYIQTVTIDELSKLFSSYNQTNRVNAVLLTKQKVPTLKFVIPCLQYLSRIQCVLLNSSVIINGQIPPYLRQISPNVDAILLFKEDRNPVAIIRDGDLTFNNIQKQFESNQLLHLPMISSAHVFNMICQTNSVKPCFLLIGDRILFENARSIFLHLAQEVFHEYGSRLAYLDTSVDQQSGFQKIFSSILRPNEKKLFIIVARRWLDNTIEIVNTEVEFDENSLQEFKRNHLNIIADIQANLKLFLNTRWQNAKKYPIPVIFNFDQRQENIFRRLFDFIDDKWNYYFERNPILRSLSGYFLAYQLWIFLIPLLIYCRYSGRDSDPSSSSFTSRSYPRANETRSSFDHRDSLNAIQVNEFDAPFLQRYTQTGAPNVIIILLIADKSTDSYIGYFRRQISLIRDSRMVFAILYLEHSSQWLEELYANIESDQKTPNVRCRASTVLALYIRRKFFVPYWSLINPDDHRHVEESGAYLGMDHHYRSSSTSSNDSCTSNSDSLSFMDWIDQLLDGSIRRSISISEWPMTFR